MCGRSYPSMDDRNDGEELSLVIGVASLPVVLWYGLLGPPRLADDRKTPPNYGPSGCCSHARIVVRSVRVPRANRRDENLTDRVGRSVAFSVS